MMRFLVLLLCGCTTIIDSSHPGGDGTLTPPDCTTRGPRMMRRLTNAQVRNTVAAAFGTVPMQDVLTDPVVLGFRGADATFAVIRDLDAQLIMASAEATADYVVTHGLAPCQTVDATCIATLGAKLFREPLAEDQIADYAALEDVKQVIATMLQSPYFLYRRELGDKSGDGLYHLTAFELASNLSYTLTDGPPDAELLGAAAAGTIDLDAEAKRLIATPGAGAAFGRFAREWLRIDDLPDRAKVDPTNQLTPQVRASMLAETTQLFTGILTSGAKASELFTASYTYLDGTLAGYYQLGGSGRVDLPPGSRAHGVLGHGSILARHALADSSSPVQRGKLVRERLLCQDLPPPPPNVIANLPPPIGAMTTRQRYQSHMADPACSGCHTQIDPVGFAFEHFDGFGKHRDQENGVSIDASGSIAGTPGGDVPLDGLDSLSTYLAGSPQVTGCLLRFLSYDAYGLDRCSASDLGDAVAKSDGSLQSMVLAIIHAPQFATRTD